LPVQVEMAENPKKTRARSVAISRQAGKVLKAAQDVVEIQKEREKLRGDLRAMYREARKRQRKIAQLKKKAYKVDLADLMQMLMMKAYIHSVKHEREIESRGGASSSSSTAWVPRNGVEALDRLRLLAASCTDPEVVAFAETLKIGKEAEAHQPNKKPHTEAEE
jgi:predicted phage gp36 major capsid-like protein